MTYIEGEAETPVTGSEPLMKTLQKQAREYSYSKWHWLWLWVIPTSMSFDYDSNNGAEGCLYFKYAFGKIWVVKFKIIYT